jgi:hypothetical protein
MSLKLNTASGGSITLQEADTASNLTLTVPAQAGSIVTADSSGNVGIGTSSPTARLDVTGSSFATANVNFARRTDDAEVSTATTWSSSLGNWMTRNLSGALTFNSGNTIGSSVGTERMRITESGNVGIGITNPNAKFVVNGSGNIVRFGDGTNTFDVRFSGPNNWAQQLDTSLDKFNISRNSANFVSITADANLQFNSGYGSVATAYGCRAWVNFNGTGTVAIRASGNVSSVSDGGTGNYTINFTNAMPDANYSVTECIQADVTNSNRNLTIKGGTSITTSSFSVVVTGTASSTTYDVPVVNLAIFR